MSGALVLNATFEPLCIVTSRRALNLILASQGRNDLGVGSIASVPQRRASSHLRSCASSTTCGAVHDAGRAQPACGVRPRQLPCQYCHAAAENIDHVVPAVAGRHAHVGQRRGRLQGRATPAKKTACSHEINMQLRRPPSTPHARAWVLAATGSRRPDWEQWLGMPAPRRRPPDAGARDPLGRARPTALHAPPDQPANRLNDAASRSRPAIVLGRAQKVDDGFAERAAAAGFEVARRVSGGTAVVVGPGECVWVDVVVARGAAGLERRHRQGGVLDGGPAGSRRSTRPASPGAASIAPACRSCRGHDTVCFAGVGPGEVLTGRRSQTGGHLPAPHPRLGAVPVRDPAAVGPGDP